VELCDLARREVNEILEERLEAFLLAVPKLGS